MPVTDFTYVDYSGTGGEDGPDPLTAAVGLPDLQRAGGRDARTLASGDWSWLGMYWNMWGEQQCQQRVVQSNYMYRLVPSHYDNWAGDYELGDASSQLVRRMLFTQPDRVVTEGETPFKTQKQLGGRAIVTDAWEKSTLRRTQVPGFGVYGHQEGYNVLYGDWSARWYGDPQQALMYWPQWWVGNHGEWGGDKCLLGTNIIGDWETTTGVVGSVFRQSSAAIWHRFDIANDVDVGVDASLDHF
jgi:hypothetical protein